MKSVIYQKLRNNSFIAVLYFLFIVSCVRSRRRALRVQKLPFLSSFKKMLKKKSLELQPYVLKLLGFLKIKF